MAQQYVKVYREDPQIATKPGIYEWNGIWHCREVSGTIWNLASGMYVADDVPANTGEKRGVTESALLKILAVAQDPSLAKDLIDG